MIVGSAGLHQDRIAASLALTRVAVATLHAFDGTAVYWGSGSITIPRDEFLSLADGATRDEPPLFLWCRFQPTKNARNELGFYTIGLRQFGLMEIEVDQSSWEPQALTEFVFNIAQYLVQSGPVIKDGDTVGGSNEQRINVRHEKSSQDPSRRAYKIVGT